MRRLAPSCALALALLLTPGAVRALTVTVPVDYATITAAIASGADVVQVRSGDYYENVTVSRALDLRAAPPTVPGYSMPFPVIHGTVTLNQSNTTAGDPITITGFHVTGAVSHVLGSAKSAYIHECKLDRGVTSNGTLVGTLSLRGCQILDDVTVNPNYIEMTLCTLLGGGLTANYEGDGVVRENYIVGPAAVGVSLDGDDGGGSITNNTITGTTDGIVLTDPSGMVVTGNTVENVTDDAYSVALSPGHMSAGATFRSNYALDPGGDGFDVVGGMRVDYNTVLRPGGVGIRASNPGSVPAVLNASYNTISSSGSYGILLTGSNSYATRCSYNSVHHSSSVGIYLGAATYVDTNTVGHSGSTGLVVAAPQGTLTLRNNTTYLNGGHGVITGGAGVSILNNIAYGNLGYGLDWTAAGTAPTLGCNDWYANSSGAIYNASPGATDLAVNPYFCDAPNSNVYLSATSPLVGTTCGQIGAKGIGCSIATGVSPESPPAAIRLRVGANPAHGRVSFAWNPQDLPGKLEVFAVNGARAWARDLAAGTSGVVWDDSGPGGPGPAPGVYFAHITIGDRTERRRVVVLK